MIGTFGYLIWLASLLAEAAVVVCAFYRKEFRRYLALNLYVMLNGVADCALCLYAERYGRQSHQYFLAYYSTDLLLCLLMYLLIVGLYQQVFAGSALGRHVRVFAGGLLVAIAVFSLMVARGQEHMTQRFAVELEQNLNFVGVVLTYVLAGSVLRLREKRARLAQIIFALGIYFSATAGTYALRNLFPTLAPVILQWAPALIATWLPVAWAYSFIRVPEEAGLMTAPLAVSAP
jgi:hypothetical protein